MAHNPPISRRELKKSGVINDEKFYRELADEMGYVDVETAKRFYVALARVVIRNIRNNKVCRLPQLGDFALVLQKSKTSLVGQSRMVLGNLYVLKFYPLEKMRQYFSSLNK